MVGLLFNNGNGLFSVVVIIIFDFKGTRCPSLVSLHGAVRLRSRLSPGDGRE